MKSNPELTPVVGTASLDDRWPNWSAAAANTLQADPFCCSPAWQLSFHNAFAPNRRLFIKESSKNIVAFAEKIVSDELVLLTPIESSWLFGNPLLGEHSIDLFSDTLADCPSSYKLEHVAA
jgi:hypothetical protein